MSTHLQYRVHLLTQRRRPSVIAPIRTVHQVAARLRRYRAPSRRRTARESGPSVEQLQREYLARCSWAVLSVGETLQPFRAPAYQASLVKGARVPADSFGWPGTGKRAFPRSLQRMFATEQTKVMIASRLATVTRQMPRGIAVAWQKWLAAGTCPAMGGVFKHLRRPANR